MALKIKLKEAFEPVGQYGAFYTGGHVAWTSDGEQLVCQDIAKLNIVTLNDGNVNSVISKVEEDIEEDTIYTFALSPNDELLVTANKSGLLKLWNKNDGKLIKIWKSIHHGPVSRLVFNSLSKIIASGGSDSTLRIWDYEKKICIGSLRGPQGVINTVKFHPNSNKNLLFASGDDLKIFAWDLSTREVKMMLTGHFSKVTALAFAADDNYMVSSSRDKVIILWDLNSQKQVKAIPLYESIESCVYLPSGTIVPNDTELTGDKIFVATAGEEGIIKIWNVTDSKLIYKQANSLVSKSAEEGGLAIADMIYNEKLGQLAVVTIDHNIITHDVKSFDCKKQLIGFSDEILDITFVCKNDKYLAVATNSHDIKVYDSSNMNCKLLKGHTDIILALSAYKNLLLSSSKDNSIRLWSIDEENFTVRCIATGTKHTASVGTISFGNISLNICVSASQDTCLKVWSIPSSVTDNSNTELLALKCNATIIAHDKDINCVCISPNDRLIATASQDKTAKLWNAMDLSLVGVFRGHKRGVWSVRFSPVDQVLMTTSADCTIRLWSLSDMTCVKSLEGHESSILRAEFITQGMQILSAGADGLIKVWSIKTSECGLTLDKHDSRIWALAISTDEKTFYSGGSDSLLIRWQDVTEEKKLKEIEQKQELALQEQELMNLVNDKKMLKALRLALSLERPLMTLKIINSVIKSQEDGLEETINKLNDLHKNALLKHAITWNTNSRNCRPAQLVINIIIQEILLGKFKPANLEKIIEETLPYTERHFKRTTEYIKDLKFIEYTLKCMKPHVVLNNEKN